MGNTNGGGSGSWREERVTSASYHTRPLGTSAEHLTHHGVVVNTDKGNSYLIHHPGSSGPNAGTTTVTKASNMSSKWTMDHSIPVSGSPTVQEVYNGAGGRTTNPIVNYLTAGTCVGAAKGAEKTLICCEPHSMSISRPLTTNESDYCTTEPQVATNLYTTLLGLNTLHPQWFLNRDFYIFGPSYAGKYIPSIAAHILQMNQSPGQVHFPLRGIGFGDGLTDPITQVADFANYGFTAGLIDEGERAVAQEYVRQVIQAIEREDWEVVFPSIQKAYEYIVLQG